MLVPFKLYKLITLTLFIFSTSSFLVCSNKVCKNKRQFYLRDKFLPVTTEKTITVTHNNDLFGKLDKGFFAQIGSNPKHVDNEDYHWFDGDGMIHGLFLDKSKITYQNKWIQTQRLQVEDKWNRKIYLYFGELKGMRGIFQILKYSFMQFFKFIPEAKGTANTAMLQWKNRLFALHEGDMPYELNIDFKNLNISTLSRFNVPNIFSTTAHPVIDKVRNLLYLYGYNNYDFLNGKFIFNIFNEKMEHIFQKNISLINNGMTHDVAFTGDHLIIPDMPLKYDFARILQEKLPMFFDKEKGVTRFGIFDLNTFKDPQWVHLDENIFIFHFSRAIKRAKDFIVYACVMDDLYMEDFVDLENVENEKHIIRGDIRLKEIKIDPENNNTQINENKYIQNLDVDFNYNLDFPITSKLNPTLVYCTIFDSAAGFIRGYVKVDTSDFENSKPEMFLFEGDMHGNSEPQVVVIDNIEYILTFNNNNENSYISLIDIDDKKVNSVKIPTRIPPGFHSIYYDH